MDVVQHVAPIEQEPWPGNEVGDVEDDVDGQRDQVVDNEEDDAQVEIDLVEEVVEQHDEEVAEQPAVPRYGLRDRNTLQQPARFLHSVEIREPQTYKEALNGPHADEWTKAAQEEYDFLQHMHVWELADLPPGRKPIGHKWVFRVKRDAEGCVKRFKARLVAQGFTQKYGVDYFDTYAPVAGLNVTRLLIAAADGLYIRQISRWLI